MNLNDLAQEIHAENLQRGFWETKPPIPELLMLVVSELAEALEADRKDQFTSKDDIEFVNSNADEAERLAVFSSNIKNTFEDEIADAIIRLFDLSAGLGIDLDAHVKAKRAYNRTRPHKHGKRY